MIEGIQQALEKGTYEWREIAMIDRHVRSDDRVVELGSCLGATSLFLYDRVGADGLIVFEADPRNLEMAQHNFELNGKCVRVENAILWSGPERPETVSFGSNENPSSSSLLDRSGNEKIFDVPTRDFETVLRDHKATVIVLDIEGGEIDLFNNSGDLSGVRVIVMEAHERIVGEDANQSMIERLEARGFKVAENLSNKYIVLTRP
ncbi:FkbM family methyltransferase [uncultured Tateyamaria sp.]|uniref:FkbM family methyltransferase n=1 Tax=uncultured Tateyamaria sp. TaxID=455651 RepID=UPI00261E7909|nr:FkbM family methyltransferase [uncultured Tateyamaria sp.]